MEIIENRNQNRKAMTAHKAFEKLTKKQQMISQNSKTNLNFYTYPCRLSIEFQALALQLLIGGNLVNFDNFQENFKVSKEKYLANY
jgi:hypothetical protein